jgi:UDP-N-acetylmuramate--alanine ligase
VTNVEADHLDHWGSDEAYAAAFEEFADGVDPEGFLVCCVDDPGAAALADRQRAAGRRVLAVSTSPARGADVGPEALDGVSLWSPGDHYLADALAAYAAGVSLGFEPRSLRAGIASYTGTRRRMEPKGEAAGVRVYDSYAHHPTEIAGDLAAARSLAGDGALVVAFQPHLPSRTRVLGAEMGEALGAADQVVVCDVYLAREDADPAVTGALVADAVPLPATHVAFVPRLADVAAELVSRARAGDLVLTLGAGDVTEVGPQVLALLADASEGLGDA